MELLGDMAATDQGETWWRAAIAHERFPPVFAKTLDGQRYSPIETIKGDGASGQYSGAALSEYRHHPREIFDALSLGFACAATQRPALARDLMFGLTPVRVRIVGTALNTLIEESCGHLACQAEQAPAATIDLWSPQPGDAPWLAEPLPAAATRWGRLVFDRERRVQHDWRPTSNAAIDTAARRIVGCFPDPAALTADELAKPLHRLIGGLITPDGAALVHAAAVGEDGEAVLLAAPGGSGKSTTALACRLAGMDYLGDDYVALGMAGGSATVHSLYASGMVASGPLDGMVNRAGPSPATLPRDEPKRLFRFDGVCRRARVAAILLPRIGAGPVTTLSPASPGDFLRAAAPHSLLANAQDRAATLDIMARAAASVPIRRILLGPDLGEVVATVRDIVGRKAAA